MEIDLGCGWTYEIVPIQSYGAWRPVVHRGGLAYLIYHRHSAYHAGMKAFAN